jgi:hypothetical protein
MNNTNSPELDSNEGISSAPNNKFTSSFFQSQSDLNSPSMLLEFLASSPNSNTKSTKSSSNNETLANSLSLKQRFASEDSIPYTLKNPEESKEGSENSDFNLEEPMSAKSKAKSTSNGSITPHQSSPSEKKKRRPPVSPLNLAPPGKITNPSQFSHLKSDSSRQSEESLSEEKSDSSSRNTLRSEGSELERFFEYKKQIDSGSRKKTTQQELGKFATFSMKDLRSYLKTKN